MIKGLRTVVYPSPDLAAATDWYQSVLGIEPYFKQPFYVGFQVGGFELGLLPDATPNPHGSVAYWGVENIEADLARILALGAKPQEPIQDVGEGIRVATVLDPQGNTFGLIQNRHFDPSKVA